MFSFPVTVPIRGVEEVVTIKVHVQIDQIAVVKALLDNDTKSGVHSAPSSLIPHAEIIFEDGRKLPVVEDQATILVYLDAYRELEDFYTGRAATVDVAPREGNVIPLFQGGPCTPTNPSAMSEGSTPA